MTISPEVLESTWKKAEKLLNAEGSLCSAPGVPGAKCVASESGILFLRQRKVALHVMMHV